MTPSKQKGRPIGFILRDRLNGTEISQTNLVIRPEELTRNDPSRNSEYQTLGGAWVDGQGAGLSTITISGHTGWRGTETEDGAELFQTLHDVAFDAWHDWRAINVANGQDPDDIELIFIDDLNGITKVVSPGRFQLRRHKTRPLLAMFNIEMTVLRDVGDSISAKDLITEAINNPRGRYRQSSNSLGDTLQSQKDWQNSVDNALGFSLTGVTTDVMNTSAELLAAVQEAGDAASGYIDATLAPLLTTAINFQAAARNAYQVLATPAQLATKLKGDLMFIASTFNDAYCTLVNGFGALTQYPDFSDMFGASTCSSTGGGLPASPYQGENPFAAMYPQETPPVNVTSDAAGAMDNLVATDPLSQDSNAVPAQLQKMSDGITLPGAA